MKIRGNVVYSPTLVDLEVNLKTTAKSLGINISETCREAIADKVVKIQKQGGGK
jgi:post-segregation antitoxin (ccd killing protein)